jgi:hydroxypyruvate isomerase
MGDGDLMKLFSEYVAWQNYAATEFAMSEVTEERAEAAYKRLSAQELVLANPAKGQVNAAKAGITISPQVEKAEQERLNAYAARKMTQVVLQNCERCAALISRELSRRIGASGVERRQMRWDA